MIVPLEEIQVLAERVRNAKYGAEIGFTRTELKLICEFSNVFWDEVDPRRKEERKKSSGSEGWSSEAYI